MGEIFIAGGVMLLLATGFGLVLALSFRFLKVEEDERIGVVEEMLPGSNCGACGQPGCRAFAEQVVSGGEAPSSCTVSSADGIEKIASFLGVDAGEADKRVARLRCAGGTSAVRRLADYTGTRSCRAAFTVNGGGRACPWGCLGLADCEVACTFDAIRMNDEALPVVDVDLCTACGDCVEVCPLDLFTIEPLSSKVLVQCSSPLTGSSAVEACKVACDACGRCALDAPEGVIVMEGGLPRVKVPDRATIESTYRCPTGAIQWVEGNQFEDDETPRVRRRKYA